jgi:hypothetical protein
MAMALLEHKIGASELRKFTRCPGSFLSKSSKAVLSALSPVDDPDGDEADQGIARNDARGNAEMQ